MRVVRAAIGPRMPRAAARLIAVFVATAWLALFAINDLITTSRAEIHSRAVIAQLEAVRWTTVDAEAAMRGYLLTGDPVYTRRDDADRQRLTMLLAGLRTLTADTPAYGPRLDQMEALIWARRGFTLESRRLHDTEGPAAVAAHMKTGRGLALAAAIGAAIDELESVEDHRRTLREAATAWDASLVARVLIALTVLGTLMLVAAFVFVSRSSKAARNAAERALEVSEARARAIVDRMLAGLIVTDSNGAIESVNPAAEGLFGYRAAELIGTFPHRLIGAGPDQEAEPFLHNLAKRALGLVTELEGRRKDGSTFPLELSLFKFDADEGKHYGAFLRDISERREIDRMKDDFISIVSHELRTPLTSIRGALQLITGEQSEGADSEHAELLTIALNNCERLIRIINDILDVSKMEAGQLTLRTQRVNLDELMRASIQCVEGMAHAANVHFYQEIEPGLEWITGDFDRLVQVFVNLLSNAVKFSPPNGVVTFIASSDGRTARISVRDQGPGIAAADLSNLFQKFRQLDSSATRRKGGTGLGLVIAKSLVEQHGGSVAVESRSGQGTRFVVTLPVAAATSQPAVPAPVAAVVEATSDRTILVVDDDADVRRVLCALLQSAGYRAQEASDGDAALGIAVEREPDLILMDLVLPGRSGLATIRALAADQRTAHIPVIIVSAVTDTRDVDPRLPIIAKPVSRDALLHEIAQAFEHHSTVLLAEDDDDLRNVLSRSLTHSGFNVLAAADGRAARHIFDNSPCDLVLLDLRMPVEDGFSLIAHVRGSAAAHVPIVVISGSTTGQGARRSLELGANLFIRKPTDSEALVREVNRLLEPIAPRS